MKYIRTKDGKIYEKSKVFVVKENDVEVVLLGISDDFIERTHGKTWNYGTNVIIKQANTVEELCDKYYGVEENGDVEKVFNWSKDAWPIKPHEWAVEGFCTKEDITIDELKNRFPKGIFGAVVWFDSKDNLHIDVVAKMNEKGVLELL